MTEELLLQFSWSGGSRINRFGELQKRENFKGQRNIVNVIQSKKNICACRELKLCMSVKFVVLLFYA